MTQAVTSEKRREVAERLRGLKRNENNVTQLNHGPTWSLAWCVLGDEMDKCGAGDWFERMCERLADLIEPGESVKCVAEVKVDGERLKKLVHDAVAEYLYVYRDAMLALAEEMKGHADAAASADGYPYVNAGELWSYADRIREASGEVE